LQEESSVRRLLCLPSQEKARQTVCAEHSQPKGAVEEGVIMVTANSCLLRVDFMSDTSKHVLCIILFILCITLCSTYYYPCFREEKTKAQRGLITCPTSHS
jgi:hypothetical protein